MPVPADEQLIEQTMQDKGLTAPHITPDHVDAQIVEEQYYQFPGTVLVVCCLTLKNGFHVTGEAAPASPANFDMALARQISRSKAREKIWPLEGYQLKTHLSHQ